MIKSIVIQPSEGIDVRKMGHKDPIIDYIVPDGFVAVVTIIIELHQKYPKGIVIPGQKPGGPAEGVTP